MLDDILLSQMIAMRESVEATARHCVKCDQNKPEGDFPSVDGKICTDCKTLRRRTLAEAKKAKEPRRPTLCNWHEAWPHLKTRQ